MYCKSQYQGNLVVIYSEEEQQELKSYFDSIDEGHCIL